MPQNDDEADDDKDDDDDDDDANCNDVVMCKCGR